MVVAASLAGPISGPIVQSREGRGNALVAINIAELQTAQDLHQIINLASDGRPTRF
jgi:hypothetical protein